MVVVHLILLQPLNSVCDTIPMLQRKLFSLTSTRTSVPKTMSGFDDLVKLKSTMTSPSQVICLRERETMKSKSNKRKLASVLGTFGLGENVIMHNADDGSFRHDVTMISFVLEEAKSGQSVIRVLSDDTDVFILLVYRVNLVALRCKIQMESWDGSVLDINVTCANLGQKCLQLPGMHALSCCDTTSYPHGKGNFTVLKCHSTEYNDIRKLPRFSCSG